MTRSKKTRSLKRIHKVKTGNAAKLKRAAGNDRQSGKRTKKRTPSLYEKFLAENPDAKQHQPKQSSNEPKPVETPQHTELKKPSRNEPDTKGRKDTPKSLLDQLDDVDFKDIY
ncbi:MAG: hypothetical protein CMI09_09525 [Oceanospirillaceae bacterium]|nr:hypothetical protein [Oceanospirillaceae bacterium]|tara:strand:+ start:90 stop:428 length:339 start_codon:yes stop_codon:yes gene_type:complete